MTMLAIFRGRLNPARISVGKRVEGDRRMKSVAGAAAIVAAVLVAAVLGVTFLAIQVTPASSQPSVPVAYGFDGGSGWAHGKVKPHAIYFGAGGNLLVRGLRWISWTRRAALGRGVRWSDSCVPSCAAGRYLKVHVEMLLSRVRIRHGISYFSRMKLQWTIVGRKYQSGYRWASGPVRGVPPFWF